jgi:hypothetical protein
MSEVRCTGYKVGMRAAKSTKFWLGDLVQNTDFEDLKVENRIKTWVRIVNTGFNKGCRLNWLRIFL